MGIDNPCYVIYCYVVRFWLIMKDDDDDDGRLCWWCCSWCYVAWIKVNKMIVTCVIWISNICVMYVVWQSGMDYGIWLCDAMNVAYVIVDAMVHDDVMC